MGRGKPKAPLSAGRPPAWRKHQKHFNAKSTRLIINRHHELEKARATAIKSGDGLEAASLQLQIEEHGGIAEYQNASITGQSTSRGGDSSKILIQWLKEADIKSGGSTKYDMLEIGALSKDNACSRSGLFNVTSIDLNSQDPRIAKQDFMERPLAKDSNDKFDIISLSLVLNYVPTPEGRGDMLRRTCNFLRDTAYGMPSSGCSVFPSLFIVLPKACTTNSRYFTEDRLEEIMKSIGYRRIRSRLSQKLVYSLWLLDPTLPKTHQSFEKKVMGVRPESQQLPHRIETSTHHHGRTTDKHASPRHMKRMPFVVPAMTPQYVAVWVDGRPELNLIGTLVPIVARYACGV